MAFTARSIVAGSRATAAGAVTRAAPGDAAADRYARAVVGLVAALVVLKLVVAAATPLAFDEALYWRYSGHLAAGFMDHPFMNPLMIRIGTSLFGQTELGVRFMAVMLSIPATAALWRAAELLLDDPRLAARSALFFNLTVVMTAGSVVATSDQLVVTSACLLLWTLAELGRSGRGVWWLAVGIAFGLGMDCKYTTLFFAPGILVWVLALRDQRKWLATPWPYAAGALAVAVFAPVLIWNAQHHWASIIYQAGRLEIAQFTLRYLVELIVAAVLMMTPPIFLLAARGLRAASLHRAGSAWVAILLFGLIAPLVLYFAWHALHERVQANWIEPVFPALAVVAAAATADLTATSARLWRWSLAAATPFALLLAGAIYLEATVGILPLAHDPRGRLLATGWRPLAREIERAQIGAGRLPILTTDYTVAAWGRFYLPATIPIDQVNQRLRWINEPTPDATRYRSATLYLCRDGCAKLGDVARRYRRTERLAVIERRAGHRRFGTYSVYRLSDAVAPTFDPPDILQAADRND